MMTITPATLVARIAATGFALTVLAACVLPACVPRQSAQSPAEERAAQAAFGEVSTGRISVHEYKGKPRLTSVVRYGDPAAAIAVLVLTDGDSQQSVALSAVVAERLRSAQLQGLDVQTDRLGYRVRSLLVDPSGAEAFLESVRSALEQSIQFGTPEVAAASRAIAALHHHRLLTPEHDAIAACTGELGLSSSAPRLDLSTANGVTKLEAWRASFHGAQRTAIAIAGEPSVGEAVKKHLAKEEQWPDVAPPDDPWPDDEHVGTYFLTEDRAAAPRLSVAVRVGQPFSVSSIAESSFHNSSPLAARLKVATDWRLTRVTATVRPRGACLSLAVERNPVRENADTIQDSATVAAFLTHEIQTELDATPSDASVAGRLVLQATDPRDAASLAAWWSHAARLPGGDPRMSVSLGLPTPRVPEPRSIASVESIIDASQTAFRAALTRQLSMWKQPNVGVVSRVETGQGSLWVLLASPCDTAPETHADAGFTALALLASARAYNGESDVSLEPWIAQDGAGILAHAMPRDGESPSALARRVSNAAAAALLGADPPDHVVENVRYQMRASLEVPDGPRNLGYRALAQTLSPQHPSWLAPMGTAQSILESSAQSVALRRVALSNGPLRLSVLANTDAKQAEVAASTIDRWIIHRTTSPRACSPSPAVAAPSGKPLSGASANSDATSVTLNTSAANARPHAWIGFAVRTPSPSDVLMLKLLGEILGAPSGLLATAFRSFGGAVRAEVHTTGENRLAALAIELHGPEESIEPMMVQTKAVLARVQQGAIAEAELRRAYAAVEHRRVSEQTDPRVRVAQLWRQEQSFPPMPQLPEWKAWLARNLSDTAIGTVRVRVAD